MVIFILSIFYFTNKFAPSHIITIIIVMESQIPSTI
jgi:hypothetical protein